MSDTVQVLADDNPLAVDASRYHLIDDKTRALIQPEDKNEKILGVETDKDAVRRYFKCPKIVGDNIDLSQCQLYVGYIGAKDEKGELFLDEKSGRYHCDDVAEDGDYLLFSWKLSGNVFLHDGYVAYNIYAVSSNGDEAEMVWNTIPAIGKVLKTVPKGTDIVERFPDVINQLFERLLALEAKIGNGGGTAFSGSAADVTYDNTNSGLDADNAQDAIDKLQEEIDNFTVDWSEIKNNPFGETEVKTVVYNEVVNIEYNSDWEECMVIVPLNGWIPIAGKEYIVMVGDEEHKCIAKTSSTGVVVLDNDITLDCFIEDDNIEIFYNKEGTYNLSVIEAQEVLKIPEEILTPIEQNKNDISQLSKELYGEKIELFYTETGEEHRWDSMDQCLGFDLSTPLVEGNEYVVTIDGTEYIVTATKGVLWDFDCVKLSCENDWTIYYSESFIENNISSYNTLYFIPDAYYGEEDADGGFEFIPHSLKIEGQGESLSEKVNHILNGTVELNVTYDDGTTGTLILFGEVKS